MKLYIKCSQRDYSSVNDMRNMVFRGNARIPICEVHVRPDISPDFDSMCSVMQQHVQSVREYIESTLPQSIHIDLVDLWAIQMFEDVIKITVLIDYAYNDNQHINYIYDEEELITAKAEFIANSVNDIPDKINSAVQEACDIIRKRDIE